MSNNLGDDLRKLMMAGVGAFSTAAEKTKDLIDDLSLRGEETAQKTRDFVDDMAKKGQETLDANQDLMNKFRGVCANIKEEVSQINADEIVTTLGDLTDDALTKLRDKIDEVIDYRNTHPEQADQDQDTGEHNDEE